MPAEPKPAIYSAMVAILKALPAIGKDAQNQGLNFKFRSIDAIINEINPALEKNGVFVLPEVRSVSVEPKAKGYAAVVEVAYHFVAEDGSEVVAAVAGEGHDFADKAVSKAMTMAFKTCLGQVFAISTEDDPDEGSVATTSPGPRSAGKARGAARAGKEESPAPPSPPAAAPALDQQRAELFSKVRSLSPAEIETLKAWLGEQKIGLDFSAHTAEEIDRIEAELVTSYNEPF